MVVVSVAVSVAVSAGCDRASRAEPAPATSGATTEVALPTPALVVKGSVATFAVGLDDTLFWSGHATRTPAVRRLPRATPGSPVDASEGGVPVVAAGATQIVIERGFLDLILWDRERPGTGDVLRAALDGDGGARPVTLATERVSVGLAVGATRACWVGMTDPSNAHLLAVRCAPLAGQGPVVTIAGGDDASLVGIAGMIEDDVVWVARGGVFRAPASGVAPPARLRDVPRGAIGAFRGGALYLITDGRHVVRAPLDGEATAPVVAADARLACLDVEGETLYYATARHEAGDLWGHGPSHGTLFRARADGSRPAEPIASGFGLCLQMQVTRGADWFAGAGGIYPADRASAP